MGSYNNSGEVLARWSKYPTEWSTYCTLWSTNPTLSSTNPTRWSTYPKQWSTNPSQWSTYSVVYICGLAMTARDACNIVSWDKHLAASKRVTWDENLCDIRTISPREPKKVFQFPVSTSKTKDRSNQFIFKVTQSCKLKTQEPGTLLPSFPLSKKIQPDFQENQTQLGCSDDLQTVVDRARARKEVANKTEKTVGYSWQADRSKLRLQFECQL